MQDEPPNQQSAKLSDLTGQEDNQAVIQIDLTPEFQQSLRSLSKRYRNIRSDIGAVIQEIQNGNFVGDRLTGIGKDYVVFKTRVKNRDIQKGKSAGYRLIYQIESPTNVLLLTLYSKSDQNDISADEVRSIVNEFYESE